MKIIEEPIVFFKQNFILCNQRAMFWPEKKILILSDLHLGKAAHFRKNGIAIPTQIAAVDIIRLEKLIDYYLPEMVLITGDLIHAGVNNELDLFTKLTLKYNAVKFNLVKGNHDRIPNEKIIQIGIDNVFDQITINGISFTHHQNIHSSIPNISGHIHPGLRVQISVKKFMTFPCFIIAENKMILPAFSLFTGLDTSYILEDARYLAFYDDAFLK